MKSLPYFAFALLLGACQSSQPGEGRSSDPGSEASTPRDMAELVAAYQAQSGHSITYSEATGKRLASMSVRPVGPAGVDVLLISDPAPTTDTVRVEVVRLEHAFAQELAHTLQLLLAEAGGTEEAVAATGTEVLSDRRTNSLVLRGTPPRLEELKALVGHLDIEASPGG